MLTERAKPPQAARQVEKAVTITSGAAVTRYDFYIVFEACIENEETSNAVDAFLDRIPKGLWLDIFEDLCDLAVE